MQKASKEVAFVAETTERIMMKFGATLETKSCQLYLILVCIRFVLPLRYMKLKSYISKWHIQKLEYDEKLRNFVLKFFFQINDTVEK
jgi:hypothetical protein